MKLSVYTRAIVMLLIAGITAFASALADDKLSFADVTNIAIIVIGAAVVYVVPVLDSWWGNHIKTAAAVLTAAFVLLHSFLSGDNTAITTTQWLQVVLAGLGAVGVGALDNKDPLVPDSDGVFHITNVSNTSAAVDSTAQSSTETTPEVVGS